MSFFTAQEIKYSLKHEVTVTLKLVQVYVTDKKGNPISDLEKSDFILYDNGKVQNITDFEKHLLQAKLEEKKEVVLSTTETHEQKLILPRTFILFFDNAFNNPVGLKKAKQAALHFVEKSLQLDDEVAILSYSITKGLVLHEYSTANRQLIERALEKIGWHDIAGRADVFEAEYWRLVSGENPKDASSSGYVFDPWGEKKLDRQRLQEERQATMLQAYDFARKLTNLAKALRYMPGFKSIIFFSSGIPYSILTQKYSLQLDERLARVAHQRPWEGLELQLSFQFEDMLKELSAANCTLYVFDTEEPSSSLGGSLEVRGTFTLQQMAKATGGKYFGNIDNYEQHLEQVERLTGCYYVLGYYVDDRWDGKYHEIKVEVKRPDVKVYAQRGYFNPKPFKEWTDLERMLHLVDLALSERPLFQTPLPLRCGGFSYFAGGKENLVLWAELVKEELMGLAGGEVEVVYLVFDKEGNMVKIGRRAEAFDKLSAEAVYFSLPFALQPGEYRLRVVMRSLETGRGAVGGAEVILSGVKSGGLALSQPLLLQEGEGRRYENMPSFLFSFDLKKFIPLSWQLKRGEKEFYVLLSCGYSGLKEPEIRIYGQLLKVEGDETSSVPLNLVLLRRDQGEGREAYLIKVETQPLKPGSHYLYFHAEEKRTSSRASTHLTLTAKD